MSIRSRATTLSLLSALLLAATSTRADTPVSASAPYAPPVPLLWKVSDADNSIYLLGSFHLLRASDYPLAPEVQAAFDDAESLVFELSPAETKSPQLPLLMQQAALRTDGKRLQDDLDPETWTKLQAYAAKSGLPLDNLAALEPWFVGLTISIIEMTRQGLDPKLGLDEHFMTAAGKAGKPTEGLEKAIDQINMLDGMDLQEQRQFVREALDEAAKGSTETEKLHAAWRAGDARLMTSEMATEMKRDYPRLYQRINVDRNDAWVPLLESRLTRPGTDDTLVVVGALHLLGEDGVVAKLKARGYQVERICTACKSANP